MSHPTRDRDPSTSSNLVDGESRTHQGSLRSKLVLSLAAMFFVFLMIDEMVRQQVIEPEFVALERSGGIRDANRVLAAMNSEVEHLSDLAMHWASRIDEGSITMPRAFLENADESSSWATRKLHWAAYIADDGSWKWMRRDKAKGATVSSDQVRAHFESLVDICRESNRPSISGMTRIGNQALVMFSVVALRNTDQVSHRAQGRYLIVGRRIDDAMVTALRCQTQVEFSLQSPRTSNPTQKLVVWEADDYTLVIEVQLTGVDDQKLANVYVRVPRDITGRSKRTTEMARNSFIFGSVAALLMLLLLLQRMVISPLTKIREHSNRVAAEGLATGPLVLTRNDEIGQLASAFDKMVHRLNSAQNQLSTASRAAGRSQVASTVIHNVGNVLTNVNSLLDAATGRVSGMRIQPLDRLADCLKSDDLDEGLLTATPDYLEGLAGILKSDQESIGELLTTLHDNIRHIHDIIRDQQRHADHGIDATQVKLKGLIDEAISCCSARLDEESVDVSVSGDLFLDVHANRSLLLQTVINIIGNARHAMRDVTVNADRKLTIHVTQQNQSSQIWISDSGCGMDDETIQQVFDAHFTTRENGTGLGLHFCALTLKRFGGTIAVSSDGPGLGSTFCIELPQHSSLDEKTSTNVLSTNGTGSKSWQ